MSKSVYLISIVIIFMSCSGCDSTLISNSAGVETIHLSNDMFKEKPMLLSEFATNIQYIPLETNEESVVGQVDKVILSERYCVILDVNSKTVFIFDSLGNYLSKINKYGRGPGEYLKMCDISILEDSTLCILDSDQRKLIRYSLLGNFINEKSIFPERPNKISTLHGEYLAAMAPRGIFVYNNHYSLSIFDSSFNKLSKLVNRYAEKLTEKDAWEMALHESSVLNSYSDTLTFWEHQYDTLYRITDINTCTPRLYFDYENKLPWGYEYWEKHAEEYNYLLMFYETTKYFFFNMSVNNHSVRIVYDKEIKEGKRIPEIVYQNRFVGVLNDLDGVWRFWPEGVIDKNRLYSVLYAYDIKENLGNKKWLVEKPLYPEKQKHTMQLAQKAEMTDNPIIAIVTCKHQ